MSCCGSSRKNSLLVILSALLLVAGIAVWRVATEKVQHVEIVWVLVATKDLPTGTAFTKENVDQLTTFKDFPRNAIPEDARLIQKKEELIGKRAARAFREGEVLNAADIPRPRSIIHQGDRNDVMSIPILPESVKGGSFGPGSRVDVIASYVEGNERQVFTLLPDALVLGVDRSSTLTKEEPPERWVSFPVDQKQALLLTLAFHLNCSFEIVVRHSDTPKPEYDINKSLANLKELIEKRESRVAPAPRAKQKLPDRVTMVVAAKDLPLGTVFTQENVETLATTKSFSKAELPEKHVTDPNALVGKRLTRSLRRDEPFASTDVKAGNSIIVEKGKSLVAVPIAAEGVTGGFVIPGSQVDVVASVAVGNKRETFTLLPDMKVLAVDTNDAGEKSIVSFAANEKQATLLTLATKASVNLHLVLRQPNAPKQEYDHDKTLARLKELVK